jgi:hypothetical protein
MLAVLILAVIMTIIYGVVVSTVQAQEEVEQISSGTEVGPAILSQIREDLEGAFLPKTGVEYFVGVDKKGATGDYDRLDFVTGRMAYGAMREGEEPQFHSVNEVGYLVQDGRLGGQGGVLFRREDYFLDNEPLKGGRLLELYDRVEHLDLQYWNGEKWLGAWNSKAEKDKLPLAVRVELRIAISPPSANPPVVRTFVTTVTFPR